MNSPSVIFHAQNKGQMNRYISSVISCSMLMFAAYDLIVFLIIFILLILLFPVDTVSLCVL